MLAHEWQALQLFNAATTLILFVFSRRHDLIAGSRHNNCSTLEAIGMSEEISGKKLTWTYEETNRIGDHMWWISDVRKFQSHYPNWKFRYGMREILEEIHHAVARCAIS